MSRKVYGYGFKGLAGNVYSLGIEKAASDARNNGHDFVVGSHRHGKKLVREIKNNKPDGPIFVFGHSMGATRAVDFCEWLGDRGIQVDCLVTLDPHMPREQQANVMRHINIWQKGHIFGVKGFHPIRGISAQKGSLKNIIAKNVRHANLDDEPWVQKRIAKEISKLASPAKKPIKKKQSAGKSATVYDPQRTAFNRAFFDAARNSLFGSSLSQEQVNGMNQTLDHWFDQQEFDEREFDERFLAYMLATVFHETNRTMLPISEYGGRSYFMKMYDKTGSRPKKALELGNVNTGDGALYRGRGKPMITGRANYRKATKYVGKKISVDFEAKPQLVLSSNHSDLIMFSGMLAGWFTGRKLSDYFNFNIDDPIGARRIVNGRDKAKTISAYHRKFLKAINAGNKSRILSIMDQGSTPGIVLPDKTSIALETKFSPAQIPNMSNGEILEALKSTLELERVAVEVLSSRQKSIPVGTTITWEADLPPISPPKFSSQGEYNMTRTKGLFKSKTFWGAVGVVVSIWAPGLAPIIPGPDVAPEAANQVANHMAALVETFSKFTATLSALYAMYGRFAAKEQISGFINSEE